MYTAREVCIHAQDHISCLCQNLQLQHC